MKQSKLKTTDPLRRTVVERLTTLKRGRSNTEFADFLGISRNTVNYWMSGQRLPSAENLRTIALACNVSVDYIIDLTNIYRPLEG